MRELIDKIINVIAYVCLPLGIAFIVMICKKDKDD